METSYTRGRHLSCHKCVAASRSGRHEFDWLVLNREQNRGKDTFVDPYDVWKCALDVLENKVSLDLLLGPSKQRKTGQMYKSGRISCGDPTNLTGYRTKESDGRERARLARKQLNLTDNGAV